MVLGQRMPLVFKPTIEQIRGLPSAAAAFDLACRASGLTDKEIYGHIGIDAGYFSNIKNGSATLQAAKEPAFCERVGNMVYPEWRAHQLGCTLVMLHTEAEMRAVRRAEAAEAELLEERKKSRDAQEALVRVVREKLPSN